MITNYQPYSVYTGNSTNTQFTFDFKIKNANQVLIMVFDTTNDSLVFSERGNLAPSANVTSVVFDALRGGGTVTLPSAPSGQRKIIIKLAIDTPVQDYKFREQSDFNLRDFENSLDFLMSHIQRLYEKMSRTLRFDDKLTYKSNVNSEIQTLPKSTGKNVPVLDGNNLTLVDLEELITDVAIADNTITTDKLVDSIITENKIANNAVTTDKILDGSVTNNKIAGPIPINKGGTGQTTKILAFDALSPLTTKGDILVDDGTNNVRLPVGSNNQVLVADSSQSNGIKWSTVPLFMNIVTVTDPVTPYNATSSNDEIHVSNSTATATVNIPSASGITGKIITVRKTNLHGLRVTVSYDSKSYVLDFQHEFVSLISNGTSWTIYNRTEITQTRSFSTTWTGLGIPSASDMKIHRQGQFLVITAFATSGIVTANALTFNLPTGCTIDTSALPSAVARKHSFGIGKRIVASGGPFGYQADGIAGPILTGIYTGTNTNVQITYAQGSGQHFDSNASAFLANGDSIDIERLEIPILEYKIT